MNRVVPGLLVGLLFILSAMPCASAQEKKGDKPPAKTPAAKTSAATGETLKIKAKPFKIEVNLSGIFEATQMSPVVLRPKSWSSFSVLKAVPHGARVKKGETLVWLDMTKIDEQLQDLEYARQLDQLSQKTSELDLEMTKTTLPLDLESASRTKKIADEDLNYFLKIGRAFSEESAKFSLKSSQQSLEYAEEELKQLEKMYNADDLTEETEEIVLKRVRNDVERSKFYRKSSEMRTKKTLVQDLPREEQQMTVAAKRADLALAKTRTTLPIQLEKQQIERDKQVISGKRAEKKLDELRKDRAMMAIKSPADGYAYYGRCNRGKWSAVDTLASQLKEGGKLSAQSVFMTIVSPRPMRIRVEVPEKELHRVQAGLKGKAIPKGYPDLELQATVQHVSPFPIGTGIFDGHLVVKLNDDARPVVPGMGCKVTLVAYDISDAITVPASAVFVDEANGKRDIVYLKKGDKEPEKRKVVVGQKTEKTWEITQGLGVGDEILLKKPDAS